MKDSFLVVNGLTYHWPRVESLNEQNIGLGYERRFDDWSLGGGIFNDSFGNPSPYIQGSYLPWEVGPFSFGLTGSLSYRKKAENNPLDGLTMVPMLSAEWMLDDSNGFNFGLVPPVTNKGGLLFAQYKKRF